MRRWWARLRRDDGVRRDDGMVGLAAELLAEIAAQDQLHCDGYPATRDGVRLGIATVEDELDEALRAWRSERRSHGWKATRAELLQAAAVALRLIRSIDGAGGDDAAPAAVVMVGGRAGSIGRGGSAGPPRLVGGAGTPAAVLSVAGSAPGSELYWNLTGGPPAGRAGRRVVR